MTKEVAEINVEEFASFILKHEIAWMSVSNAKNICGDTLTSQ